MENPYEQPQKGRIYSRHITWEISKAIKKAHSMGKIHIWTHIMKDPNTFDNQHLE
uniref:Uncharacterized protein n=1 Tax=Salmo trutta TaxID=8032 RepID=A0A674A3S1_SALTR